MREWLKRPDCKSGTSGFVGSNPTLPTSMRDADAMARLLMIILFVLMPALGMAECCCKKITEYTIVSSYFKESLIEGVSKLMNKGWQPFKGIQFDQRREWMYQIMVKYED